MARQTSIHPATLEAQELYDVNRDLLPHEQEFLSAVHRIRTECAETRGKAIQSYGRGSGEAKDLGSLASGIEHQELAVALARYEQHQAAIEAAE